MSYRATVNTYLTRTSQTRLSRDLGRADTLPLVPCRFFIDIEGIRCAEVSEVRGLKMNTRVTRVREGGNNIYERKLVEGTTFEDLSVKRGFFSGGSPFHTWLYELHHKQIPITPRDISVVALDDAGEEIGRFELFGAIPTSWEGPAFDANAKTIAFEQVSFAYDYFTYQPGSTSSASPTPLATI